MRVNFLAVLVAALSNFVIGFLLHGPVLGKLWMKLANVHPTGNEKFSDMVPKMVQNFLVHVVFAFVFAVVYRAGSLSGVKLALLVWAGFICTTTSIEVIWMGRSVKLWLFEAFGSLLVCISMGTIIAAW